MPTLRASLTLTQSGTNRWKKSGQDGWRDDRKIRGRKKTAGGAPEKQGSSDGQMAKKGKERKKRMG